MCQKLAEEDAGKFYSLTVRLIVLVDSTSTFATGSG
jgi:hypothetical protein